MIIINTITIITMITTIAPICISIITITITITIIIVMYNTITVSFHNFKSQFVKLSVSNPTNKCVAYLSVLSQISNCQGLGRKNKHEILKTDRITVYLKVRVARQRREGVLANEIIIIIIIIIMIMIMMIKIIIVIVVIVIVVAVVIIIVVILLTDEIGTPDPN